MSNILKEYQTLAKQILIQNTSKILADRIDKNGLKGKILEISQDHDLILEQLETTMLERFFYLSWGNRKQIIYDILADISQKTGEQFIFEHDSDIDWIVYIPLDIQYLRIYIKF